MRTRGPATKYGFEALLARKPLRVKAVSAAMKHRVRSAAYKWARANGLSVSVNVTLDGKGLDIAAN